VEFFLVAAERLLVYGHGVLLGSGGFVQFAASSLAGRQD
jgi:hypothetical protein